MTDDLADLAAALRRAGWVPDGSCLAQAAPGERTRADRDAAGPAGALTRLWELGYSVDATEVARALGPATTVARRRGLLADDEGGRVWAPRIVVRHGAGERGVWIIGDRDQDLGARTLGRDHVSALTSAALTLHQLVGASATGRVLDLGCGSGVQALWAAHTAREVVATDVSAEALALTRANAALNGVSVHVREGSGWEPVAGERFDLICSNAPFVITPPEQGERLVYRDSGWAGDSFVRELLCGARSHLTDDGRVVILANWLVTDPEHPTARVEEWLAGAGLDAWVVVRDQMDAAAYAEHWVRDGGVSGQEARERALAWTRWLEGQGAGSVGLGFVVGRPSGTRPGRVRADVAHVGQPLPGPDQWERVLRGLAASAQASDAALGASRPRPVADLAQTRLLELGSGEARSFTLVTRGPDRALGQVSVDAPGIAVLGALDGELSVDQVAVAVAALMDLDADAVREAARTLVREVLERGMFALA